MRLVSLKLVRFFFFLLLYHQKNSLNSVCDGEDGLHTADEPLQDQVRVVKSVPSILVRVAAVKTVNGYLQFRLAVVCFSQGLVLEPNILNILDY